MYWVGASALSFTNRLVREEHYSGASAGVCCRL